jgi:hypothetical protein
MDQPKIAETSALVKMVVDQLGDLFGYAIDLD